MRTLGRTLWLISMGIISSIPLLGTGCGPSKGILSGKVTLDGAPLKGGRVDFANKSGGESLTVEIGEDGTYTIPALMTGEYAVTVTTEYLKAGSMNTGGPGGSGRPGMPGMPGMPPGGPTGMPKGLVAKDNQPPVKGDIPGNPSDFGYTGGKPNDRTKQYVKIPAKYGQADQSGLTYKFTGGSPTYDIPLTGK